jgi:HD-GYP domain-containing protein (c-di-GMP phosphodiesterase class II)
MQVRLAEVVAVLSMATDLGIGLPMEHAVRTCLLGLELGRRLGMGQHELGDLYYLTLLKMLGCTAGSAVSAEYFVDEVAFGRDTQHLDYGDPEGFGRWVMESFAVDGPRQERRRKLDKLFTYTPEARRGYLVGHCEVAQMLASRLGFSGAVIDGLTYVFERWDGSGAPNGVAGEAQPLGVRVMVLCNEVEVHHRLGGRDAAVAMARERSGGAFDPALVAAFCADPDGVLAVIEGPSVWDDLLAAEPGPHRMLDESTLIEAGRVMADFADLKSTFLAGHSTWVAGLTVAAAERMKLDAADRVALEVGALAHDLGRVAVSTAIWDKPGPLNDSEWESVRLHGYYSERLLSRSAALAPVARLAGLHHERLDGSGYHRGSRGPAHPVGARLLAAADAYVAMRQTRAYRGALEPDEAGAQLRRMANDGALDAAAASAVLAAAGDTGPRIRTVWPAGLTDREVDVLRRVAVGDSIQEAATALHLAPKTVDFHLQNIYGKVGITTRAAATLFAIQNDLLQP